MNGLNQIHGVEMWTQSRTKQHASGDPHIRLVGSHQSVERVAVARSGELEQFGKWNFGRYHALMPCLVKRQLDITLSSRVFLEFRQR